MDWMDEYLVWNSSFYPRSISFSSDEIWTPDIMVSNQVNNLRFDMRDPKEAHLRTSSSFELNEKHKYPILVKSNGLCTWLFPARVMSTCQLDQELVINNVYFGLILFRLFNKINYFSSFHSTNNTVV